LHWHDSFACAGGDRRLKPLRYSINSWGKLLIYSEELEADAVIEYSDQEKIWVAAIDWEQIREVAEVSTSSI
jgi:hypothetical protein